MLPEGFGMLNSGLNNNMNNNNTPVDSKVQKKKTFKILDSKGTKRNIPQVESDGHASYSRDGGGGWTEERSRGPSGINVHANSGAKDGSQLRKSQFTKDEKKKD